MDKSELLDFGIPVKDKTKNIIKVIGVGGGGCNAVDNMYTEGMESVTFAVCNTDSKSLSVNRVPIKLMLGTSGLGAGADPEKGRHDAEMNIEDIKHLLDDGTKMVFVTAAMGGGTGTGAGPLVAGVAKKMGLLTIGIVTIPFYFERKQKIAKALRGLEEMRKNVDALLIINNEQITKVYSDSHILVDEALKRADMVMTNAVRSISELITLNGKIQTDFADVETTMRSGGGAIMAIGRASGEHRVQNAVFDALNSPLLFGSDISKATRILFNIYTNSKHQLYVDELEEIDAFMDELDPNIEVIWGIATDDTLDEDAKITILATGFDNSLPMQMAAEQQPDIDAIIEQLYGRKKKKVKVWNGPQPINLTDEEEENPHDDIKDPNGNDAEPAVTEQDPPINEDTEVNDTSNQQEGSEDTSPHDDSPIGAGEDSPTLTPQQSFFNRVRNRILSLTKTGTDILFKDEE